MHLLVENKGGMEIARAQPLQRKAVEKGGEERKTTLMIWEFKRYKVFAASISETKWFRNGIYEVEDHTILHSAHNMPGEGEPAHGGEGVGLVLNPAATQAWRQGGEVWEPVSPRIVAAKLKVNNKRKFQHLHLVSVYARTR